MLDLKDIPIYYYKLVIYLYMTPVKFVTFVLINQAN